MDALPTTSVDSVTSSTPDGKPRPQGWLRVGLIAAASALAGGLAAAWFYRKTLKTLQEAESSGSHSAFGVSDNETEYDI